MYVCIYFKNKISAQLFVYYLSASHLSCALCAPGCQQITSLLLLTKFVTVNEFNTPRASNNTPVTTTTTIYNVYHVHCCL